MQKKKRKEKEIWTVTSFCSTWTSASPKPDVSREEEEESTILSLLTAKLVQPVGLMDCKNGGKVIRNVFRTSEADVSYKTIHNGARGRWRTRVRHQNRRQRVCAGVKELYQEWIFPWSAVCVWWIFKPPCWVCLDSGADHLWKSSSLCEAVQSQF